MPNVSCDAFLQNDQASAISQPDSELHGEIHLAIIELPADVCIMSTIPTDVRHRQACLV